MISVRPCSISKDFSRNHICYIDATMVRQAHHEWLLDCHAGAPIYRGEASWVGR
jgi:hypothetical protein